MKKIVREHILNERKYENILAYHTSDEKDLALTSNPMWFDTQLDKGYARTKNNPNKYTYLCHIGGAILSGEELEKVCEKLNIDYDDYIFTLVTLWEDGIMTDETKRIIAETKCDGIYQKDYNPKDWGGGWIESILVFNPKKSVTIVKQIIHS